MIKNHDYFLDITNLICPMTFVRAKIAAERLKPGQTLEIRLNHGESLTNVPDNLREHGYSILALQPEDEMAMQGAYRLLIERQ